MPARMGLKPLAAMCRRSATSHAAGVDARTIWKREAEQGGAVQRRRLGQVSDAINQGETLADALKQTEGYIPQLVIDMVHVGEQTGRVDESLNRLGEYYEHLRSLRTAFLTGIAWPSIQLAIAVVVIGFVIYALQFLQSPDIDLDILGLGLIGTRGVLIYAAFVGVFALAGVLFVRGLLTGKLGSFIMTPLMRIPGLGKTLQWMAMSRMSWALGMSVESGMAADKCVEIALRSTQNAHFTRHQPMITSLVRKGESLYDAFRRPDAFPQEFLDSIHVGEETGKLGESMGKLSEQYQRQGKAAMATLVVVAGVAVWLFVAAVIIFFIFQIAFFYFGLLQDIMDGNF